MDDMSEYEKRRLETIKANRAYLESLGIEAAAEALRPAKKPRTKKSPDSKPTATAPRRRSRRSDGMPIPNEDDGHVDDFEEYRDPNDVGQMTVTEVTEHCCKLCEDVMQLSWADALLPEQLERVQRAKTEWLTSFAVHIAQFGSATQGPPSKANLQSVVKQVMRLVSGAGLSTDKREGVFAEGRPLRLGVTAEEVDALRAEAQLFLPLKTCPADLVGRSVDGLELPRKPSSGPYDVSNGWWANHPLVKVRMYCEHLDSLHQQAEADADAKAGPEAAKSEATGSTSASRLDSSTSVANDELPFSAQMVAETIRMQGVENASGKTVREALEARLGVECGALKVHRQALSRMIDLQLESLG